MTRVAAGDLTARVDLGHRDELGRLEESFNDMTAALGILLESARSGELVSGGQGSALVQSARAAAGRASRTANELEHAYRIQNALLPPSDQLLAGWKIEAARVPATELGGDFYDLLNLPGGRLGLVIGDVSGHGAASALIAAWTQGMLALAAADAPDPGTALARVNDLLYARLPARMFVTLAYAVLDPQRGVLEYANAGQCYPLIRFAPTAPAAKAGANGSGDSADGWRWLELPGLPLGSVPSVVYKTVRHPLDSVQGFILYSDGIVEARDASGTFYGFERLQETVDTLVPVRAPDADAPIPADGTAAEQLLQGALGYAGVLRPEDDMTVLVVRRYADDAPRLAFELDSADNRYLATVGPDS
jgi:serine phosphatase RsbU (regulator of sigma subunit)